jgi:Zn-dependent M28 family amino/carboxypeptidase
MEGRDNLTAGSDAAQAYLVEALEGIGEPIPGGEGYRHPFADGTNLLALVPGTTRPDELVIIGAHYDHLGRECPTATPGDDVCNGAADNAAGVAAVLEIARRLAEDPPARSVLVALWDAEEDGLLGAAAFVAAPPIDLTSVSAYLNWDIQGVNLLPSLAGFTVVVGAETGGAVLSEAATAAGEASSLDAANLSLLFGQGRSDHAPFAAAGVPVVFLTDANSACYHTSQDDVAALDMEKLGRQIDLGHALAVDLSTSDDRPAFVPDAPVATFDDAVTMQRLVAAAQADLGRYAAADQAVVEQFLVDLDAVVADGPEAFDGADVGVLLSGSATLVDLLTEGTCDAFTE